MDYERLETEYRNKESTDLDCLSVLDAARLMNRMDREIPDAIETCLLEIALVAKTAAEAFRKGGRLIYCGAGTSGRLGVLDASECSPTFGVPHGMVVGCIAGGDTALRYAVEGAEDSSKLGASEMSELNVCEKDLVIAVSASGSAAYCSGALKYAREHHAKTAGITCVNQPAFAPLCDQVISVVVGPEVLTGSTRLRAGTATKMVLNMISTLSMVQSAKVYKNLMVDVVPSNKKLRDRAIRIVAQACEIPKAEAEILLNQCEGDIKVSIVCYEAGAELQEAREALENTSGFIREAVALLRDKEK